MVLEFLGKKSTKLNKIQWYKSHGGFYCCKGKNNFRIFKTFLKERYSGFSAGGGRQQMSRLTCATLCSGIQ
jgi:hypothetical protein